MAGWVASVAPVGLAAGVAVAAALGLSHPGRAEAQVIPDKGQALYIESCQSCHQADGMGQPQLGIPSLHGVGAAAVDFYLSTGRMPEATLERQAPRKPVAIDAADRAALVAYITSTWPGGPDIPQPDLANADLTSGGDMFRTNCAACHGAVAAGAALAHGAYAPSLRPANPLQIAEAIRVGPGNMPIFSPSSLSERDVNDITAYVRYLHHPDDRGGLNLGHTGPIAEGFVGLLVGLVGAVGIATWVGHRSDDEPQERPHA